jgi:quercetin dioxygenase-like cupin family protein
LAEESTGTSYGEAARIVDYSSDSVVSRTLLDRDGGKVTLFAFDAGQQISEHITPFDALVLVLDGRGVFTVAGREHRLSAGDILHMPAEVPHGLVAPERFKMMLTMLK